MTPTATHYATKCRVKDCPWEMFASPLEILPTGQPSPKTVKFIQKLSEHLNQAHPEHFSNFMQAFQESFGLLTLMNFLIEDPLLHQRFNYTRAGYLRMCQTSTITDMDIQERAGRLWDLPKDEQPAALLAMLTDMRDLLTERGRYSVLDKPPSVLVPA